jgi:hypothetical protein
MTFRKRTRTSTRIERQAMVIPDRDFSLTRQAEPLWLSRASLYYEPTHPAKKQIRKSASAWMNPVSGLRQMATTHEHKVYRLPSPLT